MTSFFVALQSTLIARRARKDEAGASAVEYGLLVALIAAVIVGAVIMFGDLLTNIFNDTCGEITTNSPTVTNPGC